MAVCESSSNARLRDRYLAPAEPILFPQLAPGAAVFLDDAARDDEKRIIERWKREFPDLERQDHPCEKGCVSLSVQPELRNSRSPPREQRPSDKISGRNGE